MSQPLHKTTSICDNFHAKMYVPYVCNESQHMFTNVMNRFAMLACGKSDELDKFELITSLKTMRYSGILEKRQKPLPKTVLLVCERRGLLPQISHARALVGADARPVADGPAELRGEAPRELPLVRRHVELCSKELSQFNCSSALFSSGSCRSFWSNGSNCSTHMM